MKKFMAILLAMMLVLGLMPTVLAANANEGSVVFDASGTKAYTIGTFAFNGTALSSNDTGTLTYDNGVYTITRNTDIKNNGYGYIGMFSTEPSKSGLKISNGSIELSQKITFSTPEHSRFRPEIKVKNKNNYNVVVSGDIWIMNDGFFFDTETVCKSNTEYLVTMTLNLDTNVMTWNVKNDAESVNISKNTTFSGEPGQSFDCPREIKFCYEADEIGATFNVSDFKVSLKDLNFAHIKKLLYVKGNSEVKVTDGELVPLDATAVKAEFSGAIAKGNGTVATLKKVVGSTETPVAISETFSNQYYATDGWVPYITVTPTNGFEPGATYKLYLTNLTDPVFSVPMPEGGLVKEFKVVDTIGFRGIKDGDIIASAPATTLSAYVPYPENGVKFILDGKELTATMGEGNVFSASAEGMANGLHRFTVTSGEESKSIAFTVAEFADNIEISGNNINETGTTIDGYSVTNGTVKKCTGSDGSENGGVEMTVTSASADTYIFISTNYEYNKNRTVVFETDFRRIGNASLELECVVNNRSDGGSKWIYITGSDLVARTTGKVCDTTNTVGYGETEPWHNIRVIQQLKSENAKYLVYLDGVLIKEAMAANCVGGTDMRFASVKIKMEKWSSGSIQLDNTRWGYMVSPWNTEAAYKEDASAAEFTAVEDGVISGVSKVIKLTQVNNPTSLNDVAVTVNGIEATAAIDSADANSLIITPAEGSIKANEDVVISVGGNVTVLKADGDTYDSVGDITASLSGNTASAKITIAKANVGVSALGESVVIMIASYDSDGKRLKAINFETKTLLSGVHEYDIDLSDLNGGTLVRAMIWDSIASVMPIGSGVAEVGAE